MIVIAVFALVIFHPGVGFQNKFGEIKYAVTEVARGKEDISLIGTGEAAYTSTSAIEVGRIA